MLVEDNHQPLLASTVVTSTNGIIKRKLDSYVGFANLPKQWHRKSIRRGFNFNLMVVGERGLGKSTFINTLFNNKDLIPKSTPTPFPNEDEEESGLKIETCIEDVEENNVKLHLTVIMAKRFGEDIDNTDVWTPIVDEIDQRFDSYLEYETKINRSSIVDNRVHALLYFIEPTGHSLKPLDISFMKSIHEKVNLIPIIAKSDTLTEKEIEEFKKRILDDIKNQDIKVFSPPTYENDDDETKLNSQDIIGKLPYAIIGSTDYIQTQDGRSVRGRQYPWGTIEVDNETHCDFIKLRQLLIRNFMEELKDTTGKKLYEKYRTDKLIKMGVEQDDNVFKEFDPVLKQEEEKQLHETKLSHLESQMKQIFQQKVAREEKKLQETEADLFSKHKEMRDKLLKQIKMLEEKKRELETNKSAPQTSQQQVPTKARKGFLR